MDWTIRVKGLRDRSIDQYERALRRLIISDSAEERKVLHRLMDEATTTANLMNGMLADEYKRRQAVSA